MKTLNYFSFFVILFTLISCDSTNYKGSPYSDEKYQDGAQHIPGKVYCAYYDFGGEGIAYHDVTAENYGSGMLNKIDGSYLHSFRIGEAVDITYTKSSDTDNSVYNFVAPPMNTPYVGWTAPNEWTKYTVFVEKSGDYAVSLLYTSNKGGKISLSVDDKDITGAIEIASTYVAADTVNWRQWHHWNEAKNFAVISLKKDKQILTLHTVENGEMNYLWLDFKLVK
ncbi:MAG: hypothetical protein LBB41_01385 [Prevotellaceae bacterium]|jgi:hypothetical protein|nr:hypothetical protein [Prevotellaceae bacterium]